MQVAHLPALFRRNGRMPEDAGEKPPLPSELIGIRWQAVEKPAP
jgi:hypothetical protein